MARPQCGTPPLCFCVGEEPLVVPILKNKLERFWFAKQLEPGWNPIL
jgi:hypothetical protein